MKLGCISYINVLPIMLGLQNGQVPFDGELVRAEPTRLNELTRRGELDVTAVSSIEFIHVWERYRLVQGVALSSPGAVRSVKLFSQIPIAELAGREVAVTRASATSRALLQILLPEIKVVDLDPDGPAPVAALRIGDEALTTAAAPYELDLGLAWKKKTGLPMVFAVWLARRDLTQAPEPLLQRAREWGVRHFEEVLVESLRRTGLTREQLSQYFEGLRFEMGAQELESLQLFYQLAGERGLVQLPPGLQLTQENACLERL